eukprot:TRINITY_DN179_c0_g1_i1.p1 TRINITY_DN179_c0_g1~~TRINITY_DN179_c0_g1_i1.p1  ORF type:complete len:375 (-),score=129.17 TRINITY_DN179_c0_g1_i1:122-1195(-)
MKATLILSLLFLTFLSVYAIELNLQDVKNLSEDLEVIVENSPEEFKNVMQFGKFIKKFGKTYESKEELSKRYSNFKESLKRSSERNARAKGKTTYGMTKFSDLSPSEFKGTYLTARVPAKERIEGIQFMKPTIAPEALPANLDWRKKGAVTPVKDQGQCGSCWAFSATENIESMWILAGKATASTLKLAPQQIVDCDDSDSGCNGGNTGPAFDYVISAGGLEGEASYPYKALDGNCAFEANKTIAKIKSWQYATEWYSESELKSNLASWGPLSVCVDAASWQDYQGGVMTWEECAWVNLLDHCVQLVGYSTGTSAGDYWIVRNSWNTNWGISGYIHLAMGGDTCGIAHQATSSFVNK